MVHDTYTKCAVIKCVGKIAISDESKEESYCDTFSVLTCYLGEIAVAIFLSVTMIAWANKYFYSAF